MILSDISVKRPVFATVVSLLIAVFGVMSFLKLPLREYPDIDKPTVSVDTTYVGASADIVESRITQVIENIVSGIEGIRTIDSTSSDGRSRVSIEFITGRDIDAAANDVRDRVSRVLRQLPDEADAPQVSKFDSNTQEIIWLTLQSGTRNSLQLTDYADRYLVDRFSVIDGVAQVRIGGERRYSMRIWIDRKALAARGLTIQDVENALTRENVELPAGRLESLNRELTVRVERNYAAAQDFKNLVIARGTTSNHLVRIGDVATVETGAADERGDYRVSGKSGVGLGISQQSKANTLAVANAVKAEMARVNETLPPDMRLSVSLDSSLFIDRAIHEVYITLGVTAFLVILVIWAFLGDLRATLIPAVTVPVSLLGAFIILYALGFSVNLLTLLALVLAIGLVVDDSIVVLENVYTRIEKGAPRLSAAYLGTRQVAFAVIATTTVLFAVFVPISFMEGDVGRLFTEFAWAMAGAIAFSGLIALTLTPMMCSKLLTQHEPGEEKKHNRITHAVSDFVERATQNYKKTLQGFIGRPFWLVVIALIIGTMGWFFFKETPTEYAPIEDRGFFMTRMQGPEGASFEYSRRNMALIEKELLGLVDAGQGSALITIVPGGGGGTGAVNVGIAIMYLKPWDERSKSAQQIVQELQPKLAAIAGVKASPNLPPSLGQSRGASGLQFVISGPTYDDLTAWRDKIVAKMGENDRLVNVDWDYKERKPQLRIVIDRDRAADLGVSIAQIGQALETIFGSRQVTTYIERGEEYDVILQGRDQDRQTPADLGNVQVRSERTGLLIPLNNLVSMKEVADAGSLNRFNRLRAITISANMAPGYTLGEAVAYMNGIAREILPAEARTDYKGQARTYLEAGSSIYLTFILALIAVYLILAAQFESFIHPVTILSTVPFAIIGALWGLYLTGQTLNIYTQIGIIMLVGLAAKNGILIVEFANQLRDEGRSILDAIIEAAAQRLRPILMTSFATAMGAVPLIFSPGAGQESRLPIGVVIFSGILFATFLTLFIVPAVYALLARYTGSPLAVARNLDNELKEQHEKTGA